MEVLRLDLDRLQHFQLNLQSLRLLDEGFGFVLEVLDGLLVVCDLAEELAVDGLLVEVLVHERLGVVYALSGEGSTVEVLISLKANSTTRNLSISFSILLRSMRLTKTWVRKILRQFFSLRSLSWMARSAIS